MKQLLTIKEAGEYLNVSKITLQLLQMMKIYQKIK